MCVRIVPFGLSEWVIKSNLGRESMEKAGFKITSAPKRRMVRLSDDAKKTLRICLYNVYNEHCPECGLYRTIDQMHIHHIKTRGAGGDDRLSNLSWECYDCHREGP